VETTKPLLTAPDARPWTPRSPDLYTRNGTDFGAASAEDYLAKVTAFTARPPRDAETVKRPNGDILIY